MTALRRSALTFSSGTATKVAFICLLYLDLLLTVYAVENGATELNPVMASLLGQPWALALVKVLAPLLIAWAVPSKLLMLSIVFMSGVTGWNAVQILTLS